MTVSDVQSASGDHCCHCRGSFQADVARAYGVSKGWVSKLVARYRAEGETALEPRSRRPKTTPTAIAPTIIDLIIKVRRQLVTDGLDAGPDTIAWHLEHRHHTIVSVSTIARTLTRAGLVTAQPQKRPKSSYIRFQAEQPNQTWQADFTHYRLATGDDSEILTWLDDHARYALSVTAHHRITGPLVLQTFRTAVEHHGLPASTLTDNGMVFTTRYARGGNDGRNAFEAELVKLRIVQKNSRPNHPTTCGKVERFQQTLKHWLRAQPQPSTIAELQALLDSFVAIYNHHRPHRSLAHQATPAVAYQARPKATPGHHTTNPHYRVRHDRVDEGGSVSLRVNGRMHHIGIGRTHARTRIILLIHDLDIRIINATTGEILRDLTLDPTRSYQGTGAPKGPTRPKTKPPEPSRGFGWFPIS